MYCKRAEPEVPEEAKNNERSCFSKKKMVPSTGIEPVTFPMSRERATAAPTGLKSVYCN